MCYDYKIYLLYNFLSSTTQDPSGEKNTAGMASREKIKTIQAAHMRGHELVRIKTFSEIGISCFRGRWEEKRLITQKKCPKLK